MFDLEAVVKGDTTIGQIKESGATDIKYQVSLGETFIVVSDTLPEKYGGVGTDILIGMEKARFGFDEGAEINFQVNYDIYEDWGWPANSSVNARGTRFDDVIDLRAGRLSNQDGFGGFAVQMRITKNMS